MNNSCIYIIKSVVRPDRFYIGSALNFKARIKKHRNDLINRNHHNAFLQNHFNKYGEIDLVYDIVEAVTEKDLLITREQFYIDTLNPFFNISKIAGSTLGIKLTDKTKDKLKLKRVGEKFMGIQMGQTKKFELDSKVSELIENSIILYHERGS